MFTNKDYSEIISKLFYFLKNLVCFYNLIKILLEYNKYDTPQNPNKYLHREKLCVEKSLY